MLPHRSLRRQADAGTTRLSGGVAAESHWAQAAGRSLRFSSRLPLNAQPDAAQATRTPRSANVDRYRGPAPAWALTTRIRTRRQFGLLEFRGAGSFSPPRSSISAASLLFGCSPTAPTSSHSPTRAGGSRGGSSMTAPARAAIADAQMAPILGRTGSRCRPVAGTTLSRSRRTAAMLSMSGIERASTASSASHFGKDGALWARGQADRCAARGARPAE